MLGPTTSATLPGTNITGRSGLIQSQRTKVNEHHTQRTLNECDGRFSAVIPEAAGTPGRGLLLASPLGTDSYCLEIVPGIVGVPDVNKLLYRLLLLPATCARKRPFMLRKAASSLSAKHLATFRASSTSFSSDEI